MHLKRESGGSGGQAESGSFVQVPSIIACEDRLEEALHFLVGVLATNPKRGKKPVVVHSLRVAMLLGSMGCAADVIVAGLLHDVLEKTSLTQSHISRRFGPTVGGLVGAATNDPDIDCPLQRYEDSLGRCAAAGIGALLVRGADLIDNCDRLMALGGHRRLVRASAKLRMLLQVSRAHGVDERMIGELTRRYRRIGRKVAGLALVAKEAGVSARVARRQR